MKNNLEYCKWLLIFMLMLVWSMFMFMITAKADSLNISDFDTETFVSSISDYTQRTCKQQTTTMGPNSVTCTINFSTNEWNNNFKKNDYNFLIYPINHSSSTSVINVETRDQTYLVDYTLKIYLKDINNKIYNCDIVNNYIGMCRYNRDVRITSMSTEIIGLNNAINDNTSFNYMVYYQSQYYLSSYKSVKDTITNINDTINDSSIDTSSMDSSSSGWESKNATNGTITNLLTLPINFLQHIVSGFNGTCSSFNLGTLFEHNIVLPCIDIGSLLGSTLWGIIDVLFSAFMIYAIAKKLIRIFNDFTNLKDNQINDIYGGGV